MNKITYMALVYGVAAIPELERAKRFELTWLSLHQDKNLYPHQFADNNRIKFECLDPDTQAINDSVEYFFKGMGKDDIIDPKPDEYPDRYSPLPYEEGVSQLIAPGNYFQPLFQTSTLNSDTNVKEPNTGAIDDILEVDYPITDANVDAEGNNRYVQCAGSETLIVSMKTYINDNWVEDAEADSEWEVVQVLNEKWSCLGMDMLQLYFEFAQGSGVYSGYDTCFNNKKYGMPEAAFGSEYNFLDTPYTIYRNCYKFDYANSEELYTTCYEQGVQLRIAVDDPVGGNGNAEAIKKPHMYVEAELDLAGGQFMVLSQDQAVVKFWIDGTHNPPGIKLEPRMIDYTVADNYEREFQCQSEVWANSIYCEEFKVFCTDSTEIIKLRVSAAGKLIYHEVSCADLFEQAGPGMYTAYEAYVDNDLPTFEANAGEEYQYNIFGRQSTILANIKFNYGQYYKTTEPECFPGDIFPQVVPWCEFRNGEATSVPTILTTVEMTAETFDDDQVQYWVGGASNLGEFDAINYGATIDLNPQNVYTYDMTAVDGAGYEDFVEVTNTDSTIEMNIIVVSKLPSCPAGGGMTYTVNGEATDVVLGGEYDLEDNGTFNWSGGPACASGNNDWAYYYLRAAVGRSQLITQSVLMS